MVDFTKNKIQTNAPGLTYTTPKSMPAKTTSLSNIALGLSDVIEGAAAVDKSLTLDEARQYAKEQADMYKDSSIVNQQFLETQKAEAEINLSNASSEDKPFFQQELDTINSNLIKAKEQGLISPTEFKMRLMQKTSELADANPAYANDIAKTVSNVLGTSGVSDLIKMDESFLKTQQDARDNELKEITDVLKEYGFATVGKTPQDLYEKYQKVTKITERVGTLKLLSESNEEIDAYQFETEIEEDGGLYSLGGDIMDRYYREAQININDPLKTDAEKTDYHIQLVTEARKILNDTVARLPEKQKYKDYLSTTTSTLDKLESDLQGVLDGTYEKNFFSNKATIAKAQSELIERASGRSPERINSMTKVIDSVNKLLENKRFTDDSQALALLDSYSKRLLEAIDTEGKAANPNYNYNSLYFKDNLSGNLPTLNEQSVKLIDDGENLDAFGGMYNDILVQNQLISNPDNRLTDLDTRLRKLSMTTDTKVFESLLANNPDFSRLTGETLDFYRTAIVQEANTLGDIKTKLVVDKETGLVRSSDLTENLGSVTNRLNVLIKFESKLFNKNPGVHAEEVVNSIFNVESTDDNIITQEEYNKLPSGADYIAPDGTTRTKK